MPNVDEEKEVEETTEEEEIEDDASEDDGDESDEAKDRAESQIDRLKREKAELKEKLDKAGEGKDEGGKEFSSELVERTYLASNGIKDREAQEEVMRLAKKFDMQVDEALEDSDIKSRADSIIKRKQAKQSVAGGGGGKGGSTSKDVDYYRRQFEKTGDFPDDTPADMIAEVTEELAEQG